MLGIFWIARRRKRRRRREDDASDCNKVEIFGNNDFGRQMLVVQNATRTKSKKHTFNQRGTLSYIFGAATGSVCVYPFSEHNLVFLPLFNQAALWSIECWGGSILEGSETPGSSIDWTSHKAHLNVGDMLKAAAGKMERDVCVFQSEKETRRSTRRHCSASMVLNQK